MVTPSFDSLRGAIRGFVSGNRPIDKEEVAAVSRPLYVKDEFLGELPCLWDYTDVYVVKERLYQELGAYGEPPPSHYKGHCGQLLEKRLEESVSRIFNIFRYPKDAIHARVGQHLRCGAEKRWPRLDWESEIQEAHLKFFQKLGPPPELPALWPGENGEQPTAQEVLASLLKIRLNYMSNAARRPHMRAQSYDDITQAAAAREFMMERSHGPPALVEHKEEQQRVRQAIEKLEKDHREILLLELNGMSRKAMAAHLGINLGAVGTRLYRAHRKLRDDLA